ncbi:MAG: SDR family oxidoreductase [Propionicimonas sp.]
MSGEFEGKLALVTGGGVGIGRAVAVALADAGARVAITYRTHEPDPELLSRLARGGEPIAVQLDATDEAAVVAVVDLLASRFGKLDILINNAGGMVGISPIAEMGYDLWSAVLGTNLDTMFLMTRHALRLIADGGRIVNIASVAGHNGARPGAVAYATAKAGAFGFTRGLAKELAPRGITVNAVAPGLILDTPFHETFTSPEAQAATIASIALKRPGTPDDVAGPVLALCSEQFSFVTGSIIDINGGAYFA